MNYRGEKIAFSRVVCLVLYRLFARHLPVSYQFGGKMGKYCRYKLCKHIFESCGKNVNIEHGADFGNGLHVQIGDNSGMGIDCLVPNNIIIGKDVMMGANCIILDKNHDFSRTDVPMWKQGFQERRRTVIGDDVWIGRDVRMTPGRTIKNGTIIAMGTVLTKDFPEYSVVGGNPSKLIKSRKNS